VISIDTYWATIYVGLKEGYDGVVHSAEEAKDICQAYVNNGGAAVTVTETEFIYKHGREPGVIVGLINYPRFPKKSEEIRAVAVKIAQRLKDAFKQHRVSVLFPDHTVMLGEV
jgi:hypothetical protein